MKRAPILPLVQALTYLQLVSFANNLKVRLRRLKQPKYLVGALVGGAYVSLYLGNTLLWRFRTGGRARESGWFADAGELITSLAAVGVLFWMLTEWIFPAKRAALQFTETELAFLLPAPMTRRMLIQFKLLKSQIPLLFTSGLFTLIGGAGGSGWLYRWIGWWFVLFTLNLHGIGASFVLTRLWDRGLTPWPRRALVLSILAANGLAQAVTCFTGDAGKSADADYAQRCIRQLGITAINMPLDYGTSGMAAFLNVCRHQEKPFPFIGNVLAMPQLYAQIADHDVPVVLDGTGGDELFAGYWDRYYRFALREALAEGDHEWLTASLAAQSDSPQALAMAQEALRQARLPTGSGGPSGGLLRATEDPEDLDEFVHPDVLRARRVDPLRSFQGTLADALVLDAGAGRLQEWLWQNDRNAMTYGIENRSPLLDFRLSAHMRSGFRQKFVGAWNKHELRKAFDRFTPLPTQWRRDKQGFRWVYHRFLQNNRAQVLELVAGSRLLRDRVDVPRMLDTARRDDSYLECGLLQRMLCLAGLEETMGLS
jgi:hypothetical protein